MGCKGTYAHISLALAYLQYLNPDLAITVKDLQGCRPCNIVCQKVGAHVQAFIDSL